MKPSQRLQQVLRTTGVPVWEDGAIHTYLSERSMTGAVLANDLASAITMRDRLQTCICAMEKILDEGETVDEYKARIAAEDADPKDAAQKMGWFAIEDFAELCDPGPTGFRKRIAGVRDRIVRPSNDATFRQLIGTGWREYPERSEYWADHFKFADDWKDALAKARKEKLK